MSYFILYISFRWNTTSRSYRCIPVVFLSEARMLGNLMPFLCDGLPLAEKQESTEWWCKVLRRGLKAGDSGTWKNAERFARQSFAHALVFGRSRMMPSSNMKARQLSSVPMTHRQSVLSSISGHHHGENSKIVWLKNESNRLAREVQDVPEDTGSRLAWINSQLYRN